MVYLDGLYIQLPSRLKTSRFLLVSVLRIIVCIIWNKYQPYFFLWPKNIATAEGKKKDETINNHLLYLSYLAQLYFHLIGNKPNTYLIIDVGLAIY